MRLTSRKLDLAGRALFAVQSRRPAEKVRFTRIAKVSAEQVFFDLGTSRRGLSHNDKQWEHPKETTRRVAGQAIFI
jgi:hypothetical protein